MVERKHINTNPVERIKVMPEHEKFRKDLTPEMLKQMSSYLSKKDKPFYLACLMQYYTLIRPGELSHLKIGDISLKKQTIFVSHEFSKNHKDAEVGLNKIIIKLMLDLDVFKHPVLIFCKINSRKNIYHLKKIRKMAGYFVFVSDHSYTFHNLQAV